MKPFELQAEIAKKGLSIPRLAEMIGISKKAFYEKLSGKTEFKRNEILSIKETLGISDERLLEIFFADDVS